MLFLRLRRGIQKRCKWQSHARPQDTPQHTSPRQQSAATIFHSIFSLMLTHVWTGESVARGQVYNLLKNGTHGLWQDGVDIVEYCDWRRNDEEEKDCALACGT